MIVFGYTAVRRPRKRWTCISCNCFVQGEHIRGCGKMEPWSKRLSSWRICLKCCYKHYGEQLTGIDVNDLADDPKLNKALQQLRAFIEAPAKGQIE